MNCLLSFASAGREDYRFFLLRLLDSAIEHWKGDYLIYSPDHELTEYKGIKINKGYPEPKGIISYPHDQMPYQFKTALIQQALEMGYNKVIWLDSRMIINKDLTPLFKNAVTMFENLGHPLKNYISYNAERLLGFPDLDNIVQVWGGCYTLNFMKSDAWKFWDKLKEHSIDGSFKDGDSKREGFVAHRHDQAVMSVIAKEYATMLPYGQIVCPPHDETLEYGNDFYLISK